MKKDWLKNPDVCAKVTAALLLVACNTTVETATGVSIDVQGQGLILKPGEQVSYKGNRLGSILSGVNMEQVVAWKNDNFDFTNESLQGISKQLSRWYQVEMSIDETIATKHMSGIISRQNNLSKVLEILEISAGISSKIDGEKVFLYKK